MRTYSSTWNESAGRHGDADGSADLVIYFGSLACGQRHDKLRARCPSAQLLGCGPGGQIRQDNASRDDIAAVAIVFEPTRLRLAHGQFAVTVLHESLAHAA